MAKPISYDKEKIHINLAKLKKGGTTFEVVIDPDLAIRYKQGKLEDIKEVLKSEHIFSDAHKGLASSKLETNKVFETEDELAIAKIIIDEGEIQLSQAYRTKLMEEKRINIIEIIHRNAQDPRTGMPHPVTRLENAFEEAKIKVDYFKSAEDQVPEIMQKLKPIMPISIDTKQIHVRIPALYAAKSYSLITSYGKILQEAWLPDGSWSLTLELPAGLQTEFLDKVNGFTHGENEIKIIK